MKQVRIQELTELLFNFYTDQSYKHYTSIIYYSSVIFLVTATPQSTLDDIL